jgi:hypothetical protein
MDKKIEEAFSQATLVVLGKSLEGLAQYEDWLLSNTRAGVMHKSPISDKIFPLIPFKRFLLTKNWIVDEDEAMAEGRKKLPEKEAASLSLANASSKLTPLMHYSPEGYVGKNIGLEKCSTSANSSYCYYCIYFAECKFCACSTWPRESEYCFGCDIAFSSSFCLKCYNSVNIKRCFEVSNGENCSDCYFCHNVEGCQECMFCFNTKSKRYAIGNVEYPKEEYLKVKKMVLKEIGERLEKNKKLDLSIYNIGAHRGAK